VRRFTAPLLLAVAPVVAAVVLGVWPLGSSSPARDVFRHGGIELAQPAGWGTMGATGWCFGGGPVVLVANREAMLAGARPDCAWNFGATLSLPAAGVAIRIATAAAHRDGSDPRAPFPRRLDDLRRSLFPSPRMRHPNQRLEAHWLACMSCEVYSGAFSDGWTKVSFEVLVGAASSPEDRRAVDQVLRSFRLTPPAI
jgi:hypothetical protein